MGGWLTFGPADKPLAIFSTPHIFAILVIVLSCIILAIARNKFHTEKAARNFRYGFAAVFFIQQVLLYVWYAYSGDWSIAVTLPLQLCDLTFFLSIIVLITKNRFLFELLYFWGLGGATQAILTPDMGNYTFPHFVFYQFFVSHGFIILTCLYMTLVEKFKPTLKSVGKAMLVINIYAAVILPVNAITGGNYMFLRYKPSGGSVLDFLGPWPWYILSLEAVAAVIFLLLYLPFAFKGGSSKQGTISA